MGRLAKGQKPAPLAERLERYRTELVKSGGRRVLVDIGPEANQALEAIMERDGIQTIKEAVSTALISYAGRRK